MASHPYDIAPAFAQNLLFTIGRLGRDAQASRSSASIRSAIASIWLFFFYKAASCRYIAAI
jgi:hypothetical protein